MSDKKVIVARYRPTDFIVNYVSHEGNRKRYLWIGSKGDKVDKKPIPQSVIDDLIMSSSTFTDGELVILDKEDKKVEIDTVGDESEKYKNNTNSKKEIKEILESPIATMKTELEKINVEEEKQFVVEVAKEIKLDSKGKIKFLAEWLGTEEDLLFD